MFPPDERPQLVQLEALAAEVLERMILIDAEDDGQRRPERLAHLLGATVKSLHKAVLASANLAVELSMRRKDA